MALNLDDLADSSDESNESFYQYALNKMEPVPKPLKSSKLSDIKEESQDSITPKQVKNETIERRKSTTIKFNDNQIKEHASKAYDQSSSKFFNELFPEINYEKETKFIDDDLFGLNRTKTDKVNYAAPDTMPLSGNQNFAKETESSKNTPKEITDDLFGLGRPKTASSVNSSVDNLFPIRSENISYNTENFLKSKPKTNVFANPRADGSGKGDWLGLDSISNKLAENEKPSEEETPNTHINAFTGNVLTNTIMTDNLNTRTPLEPPSAVLLGNAELPPTKNTTNPQYYVNNNDDKISIQDDIRQERLKELKEISHFLRSETQRVFTTSTDKNIQVEIQSDNAIQQGLQQNVHEQHANHSNTQMTLKEGSLPADLNFTTNTAEEKPSENSSQNQNVPEIMTKTKSKQHRQKNKKNKKSVKRYKRNSKSDQNGDNYSSESTLVTSGLDYDEQNVPESHSDVGENEAEKKNKSKSRSRISSKQNKLNYVKDLLNNMESEKMLTQFPKYLEMESKMKALQLENERLVKLVDEITENTQHEVEVLKVTQHKLMEYQENYQHMLEQRLAMEARDLTKFFEAKIEFLQIDASEQRNKHELEILALKNVYEEKFKTMQSTQKQTIEIFKEQHHLIIENLVEGKFPDTTVNLKQDNNSSVDPIAAMTEKIVELRDQMLDKWNAEQQLRENQIVAREEKLTEDIRKFEVLQQTYDDNKERIMGIISKLELKLLATVQESNDQNWKIRSELNRINSCNKYLEFENERMMQKFKREEERLAKLKLGHMQEIQQKMDELQKSRDLMAKDQAQIDNERQSQMANDPHFNRGNFEAESILKLAGQTMDKIQRERELLAKQQIDVEQCRHYLREKEAAIEKREDEVEQCKEKAKQLMSNAYALKKQATQAIKEYCILKEELIIYGDRMTNDKKNLQREFEKLLNDRLELSREKMEFNNIEGRCWWCKLMNMERTKVAKPHGADVITELGIHSRNQIRALEAEPFDFEVNSSKITAAPLVRKRPGAPFSLEPPISIDSDAIDSFLDRDVRKAMNRTFL